MNHHTSFAYTHRMKDLLIKKVPNDNQKVQMRNHPLYYILSIEYTKNNLGRIKLDFLN